MKTLIRRLAWIVLFLWCVGLILLGAKFAQNNSSLVTVDLIFWTLPALSIGLVLSFTLLVGVLLGALMFVPIVLISKARIRRLRARLVRLESEPDLRQTAPLQLK